MARLAVLSRSAEGCSSSWKTSRFTDKSAATASAAASSSSSIGSLSFTSEYRTIKNLIVNMSA